MNAILIDLKLLQPVLVTQAGSGEENSSTAQEFIPGSAIRGAVIQQYLRAHPGADIAHMPAARKLFFDGGVYFLNGYLAWPGGGRMLPKPLSWRASKDEVSKDCYEFYDFARGLPPDLSNPKSPAGSFVRIENTGAQPASPARYIQVHNGSDTRQVKKAGQSFIFRYDALAKGQMFRAVVTGADPVLLDEIAKLIKGKVLVLGGSGSAEYGQVEVAAVQTQPDWNEYTGGATEDGGRVIVTLLSDAIVRGRDGQFHADLAPLLGRHVAAFTRTRVTGGFNRKWGLPLPQALAIEAGSVFVFDRETLDMAKLERLRQNGLGERRAEGYGRIAVNWTGAARMTCQANAYAEALVEADNASQPPGQVSAEGQKVLTRMAERRLRAALERKLEEAADLLNIRGEIHGAQLSRLRLAALEAGRTKRLSGIVEHIENLKEARKQFDRARIDGMPLSKWLNEGITQRRIWKEYLAPQDVELGIVPAAMEAEYVVRLLDVLLRKTQRSQPKGSKRDE